MTARLRQKDVLFEELAQLDDPPLWYREQIQERVYQLQRRWLLNEADTLDADEMDLLDYLHSSGGTAGITELANDGHSEECLQYLSGINWISINESIVTLLVEPMPTRESRQIKAEYFRDSYYLSADIMAAEGRGSAVFMSAG